jgi:hypothetical protein
MFGKGCTRQGVTSFVHVFVQGPDGKYKGYTHHKTMALMTLDCAKFDHPTEAFVFELQGAEKSFLVQAASERERDAWVDALDDSLKKAKSTIKAQEADLTKKAEFKVHPHNNASKFLQQYALTHHHLTAYNISSLYVFITFHDSLLQRTNNIKKTSVFGDRIGCEHSCAPR